MIQKLLAIIVIFGGSDDDQFSKEVGGKVVGGISRPDL